jgi:hypothetical protein
MREPQNPFPLFHTVGSGDITPREVYTTMRYVDPTVTRFASANTWNVFSMRINDVWDPDPTLGSGSVSGLVEWCQFYQKWRTERIHLDWEVFNLNSQPVSVFICLMADSTAIPAGFNTAVNFSENTWASIVKTVGPVNSGNNKASFSMSCKLSQLYGNEAEFVAEFGFIGNGTASPSSPGKKLFASFIAYSSGALTNGVYSRLRLMYHTKFWDRLPLLA